MVIYSLLHLLENELKARNFRGDNPEAPLGIAAFSPDFLCQLNTDDEVTRIESQSSSRSPAVVYGHVYDELKMFFIYP